LYITISLLYLNIPLYNFYLPIDYQLTPIHTYFPSLYHMHAVQYTSQSILIVCVCAVTFYMY
jgi:hypothetical protein